ncbi:30S ribosomal protein S8 [Candidatus Falkowbacteria bacterium]|nr:30S ribosomal protein S8 [Candidatus Falkowbacteria bacterium]
MTDPISDMLTRIRNAQAVKKPEVVLPFSKVKMEIARILKDLDYVKKAEKLDKNHSGVNHDQIRIVLKYLGKEPAITSLKRISKPGRRIYSRSNDLPKVLNNLGIAIISTPQGLMTNKEAGKKNLGGEVICEIY